MPTYKVSACVEPFGVLRLYVRATNMEQFEEWKDRMNMYGYTGDLMNIIEMKVKKIIADINSKYDVHMHEHSIEFEEHLIELYSEEEYNVIPDVVLNAEL